MSNAQKPKKNSDKKSLLTRTVDNKPWPAIIGVAFLASIGSQAAQAIAPAVTQYFRSLFPMNAEIVIFVKNKDGSTPLPDATISFIDPQTEKAISESFKTNSFGMAVKEVQVRPRTYAIMITYNEFQLINPFDISGSKQASFEFSRDSWSRRDERLIPRPVLAGSGDVTIAQGKFPPWLSAAYKEVGQTEIPGPQHNPRILEYWKAITDSVKDDETPWTSAFVEWSLNQAGVQGPKSGVARAWATWGRAIAEPELGCVVVFWRMSPTAGTGHVGFYIGGDADNLIVLGGNQNNSVSLARFSRSRVLAYRMPN